MHTKIQNNLEKLQFIKLKINFDQHSLKNKRYY